MLRANDVVRIAWDSRSIEGWIAEYPNESPKDIRTWYYKAKISKILRGSYDGAIALIDRVRKIYTIRKDIARSTKFDSKYFPKSQEEWEEVQEWAEFVKETFMEEMECHFSFIK